MLSVQGCKSIPTLIKRLRFIEVLAAIRGDIGKIGGGIYSRDNDTMIFNNQTPEKLVGKNRVMNMNDRDRAGDQPVKMLLVSCANPLTQEPDSRSIKRFLMDIPFVVTVDQFMTPNSTNVQSHPANNHPF